MLSHCRPHRWSTLVKVCRGKCEILKINVITESVLWQTISWVKSQTWVSLEFHLKTWAQGLERHTYLAQRIPWSIRWFLQCEALPLHFGWADRCDRPKCGRLGCAIFVSGGLRSRSPLICSLEKYNWNSAENCLLAELQWNLLAMCGILVAHVHTPQD